MTQHVLRGRAGEVSVALAALRRTRESGQGALLVVSGEGGIGKAALLREICDHAVRLGYAVGAGRAEESDQIAAMAPVLLALRSGREPLLSHDGFAALARVQEQPLWVVDVIVDELETRAARQPLVVCVDDFQWADPSSVFALGVPWSCRAFLPKVVGGKTLT